MRSGARLPDRRRLRLLAASYVLPLVTGPLGVEVVCAHAFRATATPAARLDASIGQAKRLVSPGADSAPSSSGRVGARWRRDLSDRRRHREGNPSLALSSICGRQLERATTASSPSGHDHGPGRRARWSIGHPPGFRDRSRPKASDASAVSSIDLRPPEDGVVFAGRWAAATFLRVPARLRPSVSGASRTLLRACSAPRHEARSRSFVRTARAGLSSTRQIPVLGDEGPRDAACLNERFGPAVTSELTDGIKVFEDRGWAQALPGFHLRGRSSPPLLTPRARPPSGPMAARLGAARGLRSRNRSQVETVAGAKPKAGSDSGARTRLKFTLDPSKDERAPLEDPCLTLRGCPTRPERFLIDEYTKKGGRVLVPPGR